MRLPGERSDLTSKTRPTGAPGRQARKPTLAIGLEPLGLHESRANEFSEYGMLDESACPQTGTHVRLA